MYCNKANANQLTALLIAHGIKDIVVCPGSRNGVLAHNFHAAPLLNAHPVTDERSAGFVALGLALATGKPAAVCVTSGSALLATLPAVSEAFYRKIPLIVISADRPPQWIGQMDGQTLPQQHALQPYADTYNIIEPQNETERWGNNRLINEALCRCREPEGRPRSHWKNSPLQKNHRGRGSQPPTVPGQPAPPAGQPDQNPMLLTYKSLL